MDGLIDADNGIIFALTDADNGIIFALTKGRQPDEIIKPEGTPYIYRWHIIPRQMVDANIYLHLQVADDPERPMHDHPWDNQSVILAGGYRETHQHTAHGKLLWEPETRDVFVGMTIHRRAEEAHRLALLPGVPYTISLFSTGPVVREWGFWTETGWVPHTELKERIG